MKNAKSSSNSLPLSGSKDNTLTDQIQNDFNFFAEISNLKAKPKPNKFPTYVFPDLFKNLITEGESTFNFSPEYTGSAILTAVSTSIGTSAKIKVKGRWEEYCSMYIGIVGNAGANKSHPITLALSKYDEIDNKALREFSVQYELYEQYQELSPRDKKDIPEIKKPVLIKSILHNFTPEILFQRMNDNKRGCSVVSDELATFFETMGNYSKNDQSSQYLSIWSSKPTSIDRVSKPIPISIQQPYLNILGGLQPRMLYKLFPVTKTDNGLIQRFLFAFPDFVKKHPINDNEMNESVLDRYNNFLSNYIEQNPIQFDSNTEKVNSKIYNWNPKAKAYFYEWQKQNTVEVNKYPDQIKGEVISKFDIHFARFALILQIMEDSTSNEISLKAVTGAAALCKYFMNCAYKVLDILNEPVDPKETLQENKLTFLESLPNRFATAEAVEIGKSFDLNSKFVQRFLKDDKLFKKLSHGNYEKIIPANSNVF